MSKKFHIRRSLILLFLFSSFTFYRADAKDVTVPPFERPLIDNTGTITDGQRRYLELLLKNFKNMNGVEIAILIIPNTKPSSVEEFSDRVMKAWQIGGVNRNGVLILVVKEDRQFTIKIGNALENIVTGMDRMRVADYLNAKLNEGAIYEGIKFAAENLINVIRHRIPTLPSPAHPDLIST